MNNFCNKKLNFLASGTARLQVLILMKLTLLWPIDDFMSRKG